MKKIGVLFISPEKGAKRFPNVPIQALEKGKYTVTIADEVHTFIPDDIFYLEFLFGLIKRPYIIVYSGMNEAISPFHEGEFITPHEVERLVTATATNLAILWSGDLMKYIKITMFLVIIAIVIAAISII